MSESCGIDSMAGSMPRACSLDLRERVLEAVASGASRREAAERFEISASSAVKWLQRWQETGSVAAKPTGGSASPLEEQADWLLALIAAIRSAVWRCFTRHGISFKKKPARGGTAAPRRGPRASALDARTGYV